MAETRSVIWSEPALADLAAAFVYFVDHSPSYAFKFIDAVETTADCLSEFAERGRVVPELSIPSVRELLVEKHRLVYEVGVRTVHVFRLVHSKQDFKSMWKSRP